MHGHGEILARLHYLSGQVESLAGILNHVLAKLILNHVLAKLSNLEQQGVLLMALADDLKAGIAKLDTETNAVAANIANLAAKIKNGMTDQEVADVKAALSAESDRLTTLAVDPTSPVPPIPPALAAIRAKK